jgi:putative PIN family toxin of toxin-antitoxin system
LFNFLRHIGRNVPTRYNPRILCADNAQDNVYSHITHPMRLVLDTNIVMDMLHFANRHTSLLEAPIRNGQLLCFTDTGCFTELERVCTYPEFGLDHEKQQDVLQKYRQFASFCEAGENENYTLPRCRDKDDQKFLILAARCQADLLVTRDKLLLRLAGHRRTPPPFAILTAEAACKLLRLAPEDPARLI